VADVRGPPLRGLIWNRFPVNFANSTQVAVTNQETGARHNRFWRDRRRPLNY